MGTLRKKRTGSGVPTVTFISSVWDVEVKLQQTTDHASPRALQSLPTVALSISEYCKYNIIMIIKLAWAYNCHKIIFGAKQTSRVSSTPHSLTQLDRRLQQLM